MNEINVVASLDASIKSGVESVIEEFHTYERTFAYEEDVRSTLYGVIREDLLKTNLYYSDITVNRQGCNHSLVNIRAEYPCKVSKAMTEKIDIAILNPASYCTITDPYGYDPCNYNGENLIPPKIHTLIEIKLFNPFYKKKFNVLEKDMQKIKTVRRVSIETNRYSDFNMIALGFFQDTQENLMQIMDTLKKVHKPKTIEKDGFEIGNFIYFITTNEILQFNIDNL